MGELKPVGSEKLESDEKLNRILELTYYQTPIKATKTTDVLTETKNGVYGVVKEKDGYYVKKGLNEESLDYIGGLFMKNKNRFSSYKEAFKKLEFLVEQEKLDEATRYLLKTPKSAAKPQGEGSIPEPTGEMPPSPAVPDQAPPPTGEEMPPETGETDDFESPESEEDDYKKIIQKLSGRLQEKLNSYKERLESEDYKYVIKMILSAVDFEKLEKSGDKDEILDEFFPEKNDDMGDSESEIPSDDAIPPEENELGEIDGMSALEELINNPFEDDSFVDDDDDDDLSSVLDFEDKSAEKAALQDIEKEFVDDDYNDDYNDDEIEGLTPETEIPSEDEIDETSLEEEIPIPDESAVKELDINELTDMVNTSVKETLSKYFES